MTTSVSGTSSTTSTSTTSTTNYAPNSIGYTNDQSSSHVFGLASGMDVDSMVKKLMDAASIPLVQMEQQKQLLEWQQDDYRSMNSLLLDLKNQTFDMSLQGTFLTKQVSSSDDTKLTATAGPSTPNTSFTIKSATMATAEIKNSSQPITTSTTFDGSQSFWDSRSDFTNQISWNTQSVSGEVVSGSGTTYQLAKGYIDGTPTLMDGTTQLSVTTNLSDYNASGSTYNAYVDPTTGQVTLRNAPTSGSLTASYTVDKSIDFSISTFDSSGKETTQNFSFLPTDNLNTMISQVNSSNLGISAFYSSSSQKVSFSRNQTGNLNPNGDEMVFSGTNSAFLTSTLSLSTATSGTDGVLNLNGVDVSSHTNTFTVNGMTYNLKGNILQTDPPVTLNVSSDTDGVFDKIKAWVDKYNSTIDAINSKISEKRDRSYQPLTNQQMSSMSATQIQQWTDKAKSGMIANDMILGGGLSQMREDLYTPVTNSSKTETYTQLSQIGITTSSNYLDNGKLEINDDQLKQALAADPQSVMDLFTNTSDNYSEQGLMQRLNTTITNTMNEVTQKAGNDTSTYTQYDLGQELHDYDTRISDFQQQLNDLQTRYYNQFSAMETAINSANQQSAYIQNNFN